MPTKIKNNIAVKITTLRPSHGLGKPYISALSPQECHFDGRNYQPKVNQSSIMNAISNDNKISKLEQIQKRKWQRNREYQMLQEEKIGMIGSLNSKGRDYGTQMNFSE